MQQLINTVCFPPRRVLWQQPQDSLKSGQGSLSKVPLSPNNVTNSVLTWMLLQEVPEIGKITQLIKLAVRKPSAKCRDALPQQPWVCSPRGAQDLLGRRGSSHLPAPWAGVCSSGGTQGKNQLPTQDSWGAHGFPPGDSRAPRCPKSCALLGRGSVRALLWLSPVEPGTGWQRAPSRCATTLGDPHGVSPRGSLVFNTSLLMGFSV